MLRCARRTTPGCQSEPGPGGVAHFGRVGEVASRRCGSRRGFPHTSPSFGGAGGSTIARFASSTECRDRSGPRTRTRSWSPSGPFRCCSCGRRPGRGVFAGLGRGRIDGIPSLFGRRAGHSSWLVRPGPRPPVAFGDAKARGSASAVCVADPCIVPGRGLGPDRGRTGRGWGRHGANP